MRKIDIFELSIITLCLICIISSERIEYPLWFGRLIIIIPFIFSTIRLLTNWKNHDYSKSKNDYTAKNPPDSDETSDAISK